MLGKGVSFARSTVQVESLETLQSMPVLTLQWLEARTVQ